MTADERDAQVTVRVVGTARGNPGLAGAGIVVVDAAGVARVRIARYLGNATPLEAQLQALELALRYARPYAPAPLRLELSNETAVRQLGGEQPPRHPNVLRALGPIYDSLAPFAASTFALGRPDDLAEAAHLADLGIDTRLRPLPMYDAPPPE
jgi:ribonuclease HI